MNTSTDNALIYHCADDLRRLAMLLETSTSEFDAALPEIERHLGQLAPLGFADFQIEGPALRSRQAGSRRRAHRTPDADVVYQVAIVMPGGVGVAVWQRGERDDFARSSDRKTSDLHDRFIPYDRCPPAVRSLIASETAPMLESLSRAIAVLGS